MNTIGIYIHIPFCDQKCPYCDFYSISGSEHYDEYTKKLTKAIHNYSQKYNRVVDTVYFGGGTPSVIQTDRLVRILNEVKNSFSVSDGAEITLEVNPCSADKLDFSALRLAGFNRLSIGLQSANENELKALGRRHTAQKAKETVEKARQSGLENISLDLMLCVPGQTKNSLTESIKFCKDCGADHISAYILKIEENTRFYQIKDTLQLFDDDEQSELYLHAVSELEKYGYHQYEISNFSKIGFEGKHNLKYWRDEEYLGLGPSAHSFIDGERFYFLRSFDNFYNDVIVFDGRGGDISEYIMLQLRLNEGVSSVELLKRYNFTFSKNFIQRANKLKLEGLVTFNGETLALTKKGFLVSNTIINYLFEAL